MKFNKILLASILLAIITIGAVSANEDTTADETILQEPAESPMAADISAGSACDEQTADEVTFASSDDNNKLSVGDKKNVSYEVYYGEYYVNDYDSHNSTPLIVIWNDLDATGNFAVSWGTNGGFSIPIQYADIDYSSHNINPVSSISFSQIFNEIEGNLDYGVSETVTISYEGDSNYNGFTISHKFIINYMADLSISDYNYGATPNLSVYVPNYGGDATVYVNGKKFKDISLDYDEIYKVQLEKLNYDDNTVAIKLSNGAQISEVFTISASIYSPSDMIYGQDESISLNLPNGAQGNLFILIDEEQVFNQKVNGYVAYSLSDLPAGEHIINAFYTGTDYSIGQILYYLDVSPNVTVPSKVQSGVPFDIAVNSGVDGKLTLKFYKQNWEWEDGEYVYKGDKQEGEPLVINVNEGGTTYTISDVPVIDKYYPDISDTENCFPAIFMKYEWQPTGSSSIVYSRDIVVRVISDSRDPNITSTLKDYIFQESYISFDVELPVNAEGNVSFYVDGNYVETNKLSDSRTCFSYEMYDLALGNHTFELRYSGDDYFNPAVYKKTVTVSAMGVDVPEFVNLKDPDDILDIQFLDDMGGFYIVYINDEEYKRGFASKGHEYVQLDELPMGSYEYKVVYSGDENNDNLTIEGSFIVSAYDFYVNYNSYVYYGEEQVIEVNGPSSVGGKITVKVYPMKDSLSPSDVKTFEAPFVEGIASVKFSDIPYKNYMFTVRFSGDDDCDDFYIENNPDDIHPTYFYFEMDYNIEVTSLIYRGDDASISVAAPEGVTGTLNVLFDNGQRFSAPISGGIAKVTIPHPAQGSHDVEVSFVYNDGSGEKSIGDYYTIYVVNEIKIPEENSWIYGENKQVSLELPANAKGSLKITDYDEDDVATLYKEVPLVNGKAIISLKDLKLGGHFLTFEYTGRDYDVPTVERRYFAVELPQLVVPDSISYGENRYIDIPLPQGATGKAFLTFGEIEIEAVNGRVSLASLLPGYYDVWLRYSGNMGEIYQSGGHLEVLKVSPEMNITVAYGNTGVEVILPSDATGEVIVDVEGNKYYGIVENGKAIVKFDGFEPGEYYVEVLYSGDDFYDENVDSTILNVEKIIKKATSITVIMVNGLDITSILKDENGDGVANLDVVCYVGDVKVTAKTNAKGEFTVKAKNNALLNMTFEGDPLYNASGAVIMLKNLAPVQIATKIEVPSNFQRVAVDYNAGETGSMFYFTLKDIDGNPLAKKGVKIGIFDKIYTVRTDKNGKAGLQINIANANYYTYGISFLGDDDYKACFAVSCLQIVKKPITITPAKTSYSFKANAKTKTVTATLKSSNSYIPKGKQVTLTIAGKTFKAKIGDKGQISFNIGSITKKGTYKVTVNFAGTNTYNAAASKALTIKIA